MKSDWVTGDNEEPELLQQPTARSNGDGYAWWCSSTGDYRQRVDGYGDSEDGDGSGNGRGQYEGYGY